MNHILRLALQVLRKIRRTFLNLFSHYRLSVGISENIEAMKNIQMATFWYGMNQPGELLSDTKKRFFANMPPAEGVVREVQLVIKDMLEEMDRICRECGIEYWLMGGTLIGAIRHKGFIPWDNDGDVGMLRSDYEKFKEAIKDSKIIDVKEFYNFNRHYRIPKIVAKGTAEKIDIDIIVFDYANRGSKSLSETWAQQKKFRSKLILAMRFFHFKVLSHKSTDLIYNQKKLVKLEKLIQKYVDNCHYLPDGGDTVVWGVDNFTSMAVDRERIYDYSSIFPLKELEFEGHTYYVVSDYMDMITREAGDIWTLPPDIGHPKGFSEEQMKAMVNHIYEVREKN